MLVVLMSLLISQITEPIDLIPSDGNVAKITCRVEGFHSTLQHSFQIYLPLMTDCLATLHQPIKILSAIPEATGQMSLTTLRKKEVEVIDGSEPSTYYHNLHPLWFHNIPLVHMTCLISGHLHLSDLTFLLGHLEMAIWLRGSGSDAWVQICPGALRHHYAAEWHIC
ncbi:hypothetical protein EDC04DRAFT_2598452 [Pisolithus marmoratus]|nr:hypothetical protein EDC04DRAFT_2598452 [Pisolithus marmoratus]